MITPDDLIRRFGKQELIALTDKDGLNTLNLEVLAVAINDAIALVASYLGLGLGSGVGVGSGVVANGRISPILTAKTCDIARFYLYDDNVTDTVKYRYDEAIDWLKQVQNNPSMLGINKHGGQVAVLANPTPSIWADSPLNQDDNDPVYY